MKTLGKQTMDKIENIKNHILNISKNSIVTPTNLKSIKSNEWRPQMKKHQKINYSLN
jgi:hypothetical protein